MLRDKVAKSQGEWIGVFSARSPEKTWLSALELFKAELDGCSIDEISGESKSEVQKCLCLMEQEAILAEKVADNPDSHNHPGANIGRWSKPHVTVHLKPDSTARYTEGTLDVYSYCIR